MWLNIIKTRLTNQGKCRDSLLTDSEKLRDIEINIIINSLGNSEQNRKIIGRTLIQKHEAKYIILPYFPSAKSIDDS